MDAEYLIHFHNLALFLKNLQVRKEFKNVYMRWKTKDKTYGIQKPTQHFVRGIFTLFTSLCPLFVNETFCTKHVLFFTCSSPLFDLLFKRSIHGLPYFHPISVFLAILSSDPTSPPLGIQDLFEHASTL